MENTELDAAAGGKVVPSTKLRRFGFAGLCLVLALVCFGIQQGCASVNAEPSWAAGTFWFGASAVLLMAAVWLWDRSANRHLVLRIGFTMLALVVVAGFSYGPIVRQYRREHTVLITPKSNPAPVQPAQDTPQSPVTATKRTAKSRDSTHAKHPKTVADAKPPTPASGGTITNNCPGGICISGGTVSNPTVVNNGPPPAKIQLRPWDQNQQNNTAVAVMPNGPPNLETLYHSTHLIEVTGSAIPGLHVSAKGPKLRQLECGLHTGMYQTVTAVNGEADCTMHSVFGDDWFFGIQTLSPVSHGDVRIDLICLGIRCEQ